MWRDSIVVRDVPREAVIGTVITVEYESQSSEVQSGVMLSKPGHSKDYWCSG